MFGWFRRSKIQQSERDLVDFILLLMREDPDEWKWSISPTYKTAELTYTPRGVVVKIDKREITIATDEQESKGKSLKTIVNAKVAKELYEAAILIQNDWAMKKMRGNSL